LVAGEKVFWQEGFLPVFTCAEAANCPTKDDTLMDLKGKGCLITGGTSGIGAATAIDFAKRGAHISVTGRTRHQETLRQLQVAVEEHGSRFLFVQADAGNAEDCRRCVDETHAAFGRLDVLVHSAGGAVPGGFFEVTEELWMKAFDVHVHAVLWLSRAAVPHMVQQGKGAIILIGSAAGLRGCLGAMAYGVVKGVLPQFARALARELANNNIRVNCVSPGIIRTPFQNFLSPEQVQNNINNRIPLHREGQPEDVAHAIAVKTKVSWTSMIGKSQRETEIPLDSAE
jgi:NAD(P)-dependent dehydrogenase (short-subunit alcohol dehydrogenase family)